MTETQHKIFYLTRHPPFLWGLALGTLGLGLIVAFAVNFFRPAQAFDPAELLESSWRSQTDPEFLEDYVRRKQEELLVQNYSRAKTFAEALQVVAQFGMGIPRENLDAILAKMETSREMDPQRFEVVRALLRSVSGGDGRLVAEPEAVEEVEVEDPVLPPPLKALEQERQREGAALADVYLAQAEYWLSRMDYEKADAALQKADAPQRLSEVRSQWVEYLLYQDDLKKVKELMQRPGFEEHIGALTRYIIAAEDYDWEGMVRNLVPGQYEGKTPGVLFLAGLTGIFWWLILLRIFQVPLRSTTTLLTLAALVLGAISTWPTLLGAEWQAETWGLDREYQAGDALNQIIYSVASTGLREETCKLLLFLPLVPILLKRNDDREMLLVAACVGLGFAIEENLNYFQAASTAVSGRFVTANFAHCIFTGLIGYNFCRCLRNWRQDLSSFLGMFTIIVFSHGLYNALMSYELGAGFLSIMLFIFLSWMFFELADSLRASGYSIISATSLFIFGLALMLSSSLVVLSFQMPVLVAGLMMTGMAADTLVLGIMFVRCFGEVSDV